MVYLSQAATRLRVSMSGESAAVAKAATVVLGPSDMPTPWQQSLVREHLPNVEAFGNRVAKKRRVQPRVQLFRSSMESARTVLQHACNINLTLSNQAQDSSTRRSKKDSNIVEVSASEQLQARARALRSILSRVDTAKLQVTLVGDVLPLWEVLPKQNVTCLHLEGITLTPDLLLNQLQLQQCSNLQTLQLHNCGLRYTEDDIASLSQDRSAWLPSSLKHMDVGRGVDAQLLHVGQLFGPQIRHLECKHHSPSKAIAPFFTALTHVTTGFLNDAVLEALLAIPSLTHVNTRFHEDFDKFQRDYSSRQCRWQQLEIKGTTDLYLLLSLPLASIQRVLLGHRITYTHLDAYPEEEGKPAVYRQLASLSNIQLQPGVCSSPWGMPGFDIDGSNLDLSLKFCIQHMAAPTSTLPPHPSPCPTSNPSTSSTHELAINLNIGELWGEEPEYLAPSLHQLPTSVTALCFTDYLMEMDADEVQRFCSAVITALPPHIQRLAVNTHYDQDMACAHARAMAKELDNSQLDEGVCVEVVLWRHHNESKELKALQRQVPGVRVVRYGAPAGTCFMRQVALPVCAITEKKAHTACKALLQVLGKLAKLLTEL